MITGWQCLPVIAETTENSISLPKFKKKNLDQYEDFSLISYQTLENSTAKEAVLILLLRQTVFRKMVQIFMRFTADGIIRIFYSIIIRKLF